MSMIKRGASTGKIEQYTQKEEDGAIVCKACMKIIVSKTNLEDGKCPYCHNNVKESLNEPDFESEGDVVAEPC